MGKTKAASKVDSSTEPAEKCSESLLEKIWPRLEAKLNAWIANTLPVIAQNLVKTQARKEVDDYVSSTEFGNALPESLHFASQEIQDSIKVCKEKITNLEVSKLELLDKIDDLEQYTRRTNIRILGIPEDNDKGPENTDDLAINFCAQELGINLSHEDISRSHRVGKRSAKPRPIIVCLVRHNSKVAILRKRRLLKENKRPFNVQEYLTLSRRNILRYLQDI